MNLQAAATIAEVYPRYSQGLLRALAEDYHDQLDSFLAATHRATYRLGEMFAHERAAFSVGPDDVVGSCSLFFKPAGFARRDSQPQRDDGGQILPSEVYKVPHPAFVGTPREPKSFFENYVRPLLERAWPSCKVVVFLASDLLCLQGVLQASGINVVVMKHPGIAHNPGAMWRYLALNFNCKAVYVTDTDQVVPLARIKRYLGILEQSPKTALVRQLQATGKSGQEMALILGGSFMVRPALVEFNVAQSMLGYVILNILTEDRPGTFVHEHRQGRPYFAPRLAEENYAGPKPNKRVPRKCFTI